MFSKVKKYLRNPIAPWEWSAAVLIILSLAIVGSFLVYAEPLIHDAYQKRGPKFLFWLAKDDSVPLSFFLRLFYERALLVLNLLVASVVFYLVLRFAIVRQRFLFFIWNLVALSLLTEISIVLLFMFPGSSKFLPDPLLVFVRSIYLEIHRDVVQLNPNFYRYDPELTYTLNPGKFVFQNPEFKTEYFVNSLGVRDDEQSLLAPEIVVIGDSFALGWGVEQDESFPQQLEKMLGKTVLNAGISSYGTARELMLLKRIDLSNLTHLIIQHSLNDSTENSQKVNEGRLSITPKLEYEEIVREFQHLRKYRVGKYFRYALKSLSDALVLQEILLFDRPWHIPPTYKAPDGIDTTEDFLELLSGEDPKIFENVKIIVVSLTGHVRNNSKFMNQLNELKQVEKYPDFVNSLTALDTSSILKTGIHDFVIDDHMRANGHHRLAEALFSIIKEK